MDVDVVAIFVGVGGPFRDQEEADCWLLEGRDKDPAVTSAREAPAGDSGIVDDTVDVVG